MEQCRLDVETLLFLVEDNKWPEQIIILSAIMPAV